MRVLQALGCNFASQVGGVEGRGLGWERVGTAAVVAGSYCFCVAAAPVEPWYGYAQTDLHAVLISGGWPYLLAMQSSGVIRKKTRGQDRRNIWCQEEGLEYVAGWAWAAHSLVVAVRPGPIMLAPETRSLLSR